MPIHKSQKAIAAALLALSLQAGVAAAQDEGVRYTELPGELRSYVDEVRESCKGLDESSMPYHPMQGIMEFDLEEDGSSDLLVAAEYLCERRMAGANCTNRGCDLQVWKEVGPRKWRKIFDDHPYDNFISIDYNGPFRFMVLKIHAESPQCRPDPAAQYSAGHNCDVIVRYRGGDWVWEKIE